jgi:hypothetical protein
MLHSFVSTGKGSNVNKKALVTHHIALHMLILVKKLLHIAEKNDDMCLFIPSYLQLGTAYVVIKQ